MTIATTPDPESLLTTLLDGADPSPLFEPATVAGLELSNRFAMAPMTRSHSPGGVPTQDVVDYYVRRAQHLGLIVTEGTYVDHPSAGRSLRVPRFYGDDALTGWQRVVEGVHAVGGRIVPQLWHIGAVRSESSELNPEAPVITPSGIDLLGRPKGVAASRQDIGDIAASFARAARDAERIGFDGIEIHGAHGYLFDEFFWPGSNLRGDEYGGGMDGRVRMAAEVVGAIREAVSPGFPIVLRISQWKGGIWDARNAETPQELEQWLLPLREAGVDVLHISTRRYWLPAFEGSELTLAGWAKKVSGLPVIAVGSLGIRTAFGGDAEEQAASLSIAPLLELFERGEFDLVALGRAVLSDPEWTLKLREGRLAEIRGYRKEHEAEPLF